MLITSCTIGGTSVLSSLQVKSTRLRFGALGEVSTASLECIGLASSLGPVILAGEDIVIGTAGGTIFSGTVASVDTDAVTVSSGKTRFLIQAQGKEASLLDTVLTSDVVYSSTNDSTIITAVFGSYLPSIDVSHVSTVASISITARAGWTIRQFLDEVISRSAAIYYMSGTELWFHADTGVAAPFNLDESPGGGEISPLWKNFSHSTQWANRANRVTVLGQASTGGVRITATVNDATSQSSYGVISRTVVDANITSTGEATARGNVELANYANPQVSGRFGTFTEGFEVGQSITITMPSEVIATACFIRSVEWSWETPSVTMFTCEYGQFGANLVRRLQRALQDLKPQPYVTIGIPAPSVISASHFAATIEPVGLVTATPNGSEELAISMTTKVVYNTTDKKTYRWDSSTGTYRRRMGAGDLEADSVTAGTIAAGAIRAVDAAFDTAAIQTADIANAAITTAKIATANITTALIADANITTAKILDANVTTAKIADANITTAKIANLAVTDALIANATITSAKIVSLDASKINAGTITVGSGGITFSGTGGIIMAGGGNIAVTPGAVNAGSLTAKIAAGGWEITGSPSNATISYTGTSVATVNATAYSIGGTGVIDSSRGVSCVDINVTGVYKMDGSEIVNTSGAFIGIGTGSYFDTSYNTGGGNPYRLRGSGLIDNGGVWISAGGINMNAGIGATSFNIYGGASGATGSFTTTDGKTITVTTGIITAIV